MTNADFPFQLRVEHEGCMSLRVERAGRRFRFDPVGDIQADDVVVLTWNWPEHLRATVDAVKSGLRPTVIAAPPVLEWLSGFGAIDVQRAPTTVDGVAVELVPYEPIPYAAGVEAVRKVRSALTRPDRAVRRLAMRARMPSADPVVVQLTFPGGARLLHLNLSLHSGTPAHWLEDTIQRFKGADWLFVGVDHGEDDAVGGHLARFECGRVIVTDLVNDVRRAIGMPAGLLTPLVDRAIAQGLDAYVFTKGAGMRFE